MSRLFTLALVGILALIFLVGCCVGYPKGGGQSSTNNQDGGDPPLPPGAINDIPPFLADLPADARPKDTGDTVAIERANVWLKVNAPGKPLVWDYPIGSIGLQQYGNPSLYIANIGVRDDPAGKIYAHLIHGVYWRIYLGSNTFDSLSIPNLSETTANQLLQLKYKAVRVVATVDDAKFQKGALYVRCSGFVLDGITTGRPLNQSGLNSPDPADRKKGLAEMALLATPGSVAQNAEKMAKLLKEDPDEDVRRAVALAVLTDNPKDQAALALLPSKAAADGKYRKLLRVIPVASDRGVYGDYKDEGHWPPIREWGGFKDLPEGYWVYVYPYWFIWREPAN
jgi:hypothetical protein